MAPTVCVAEFPMTGTTVSALVRRRRRSESGVKRRKFALEEILRAGTNKKNVETLPLSREHNYADTVANCSAAGVNQSVEHSVNESHGEFIAKRRKDLLNIVIRTIILVRRNRILQKRLNALRAETRRFLSSMLDKPENQLRSHSRDPASAEKIVSTLSPELDADPTSKFSRIIFNCDNHDCVNDETSTSEKSEDSSGDER